KGSHVWRWGRSPAGEHLVQPLLYSHVFAGCRGCLRGPQRGWKPKSHPLEQPDTRPLYLRGTVPGAGQHVVPRLNESVGRHNGPALDVRLCRLPDLLFDPPLMERRVVLLGVLSDYGGSVHADSRTLDLEVCLPDPDSYSSGGLSGI